MAVAETLRARHERNLRVHARLHLRADAFSDQMLA